MTVDTHKSLGHDDEFYVTSEEVQYAESLTTLSDAVHKCKSSEAITLRLSTCRNIYLTINAVFHDCSMILEHRSDKASRLAIAIDRVRRRDTTLGREALTRIDRLLSFIKHKLQVWEDRKVLDDQFSTTVSSMTQLEQDRIQLILSDVRTYNSHLGIGWELKYYELSVAEPGDAARHLALLCSASRRIRAINLTLQRVCDYLCSDAPNRGLYDPSAESVWKQLHAHLVSSYGDLELSHHDSEIRFCSDEDLGIMVITEELPDRASDVVTNLIDHLSHLERRVWGLLGRMFKRNESPPPLPPPFVVDLRDHQLSDSREELEVAQPKLHDWRGRVENSARIALLECGVPKSWYNERDFRYVDEDKREHVRSVARAAILQAGESGVSAVVMPEYFLPRAYTDELCDLAESNGVALIAGQEAVIIPSEPERIRNAVVIKGNGETKFEQSKQRPSGEEAAHLWGDTVLHFVRHSSFGSFATLVCSDFMEWDLLNSLASYDTLLDVLFVCAANPYPSLFDALARADAMRLYCSIVIVNNCYDSDDGSSASSQGTGLWSPRKISHKPDARIDLACPGISANDPKIAIYTVPLAEVRHSRLKPASGFFPSPKCRQVRGTHGGGLALPIV